MPIQELIMNRRTIRIGSRTSELALKQTNLIVNLLSKSHSDLQFKIITMDTIGDLILDKELSKIGDKSLFTKELELALLSKEVDFVVHSLKDVPTDLSSNFTLGCVCLRESPEDAVVMKSGSIYKTLEELPKDSVVGTSSVRRIAQMKQKFPHLQFCSVRGNLNTRFRKLDSKVSCEISGTGDVPNYSALILAKAGLERIGLHHRISQVLSATDSLYAVGQGALACECRADDLSTLKLLSSIHDDESGVTTIAERSLMRRLNGGCSTPIGVRSSLDKSGLLTLQGVVMSVDGRQSVSDEVSVLLPEEDIDIFMEKRQQHQDTVDEQLWQQGPPAKRQKCCHDDDDDDDKSDDITTSADCPSDVLTDDAIRLGRDSNASFLGVRVSPICEIGRVRMALSQRLGAVLAERLLQAGARSILDGIEKTPIGHNTSPPLTDVAMTTKVGPNCNEYEQKKIVV